MKKQGHNKPSRAWVILVCVLVCMAPAGSRLQQAETGLASPDRGAEMISPSSSGLSDFSQQLNLSFDQAVELAMENNLDLANARREVRLSELSITRAKSAYDPYLQADGSHSYSQRTASQRAFGEESETTSVNVSSGVNTWTGGSMSVDFRNSRQETDSIFSTLNPYYNTELSVNLSQPLLKNRFKNTRAMDLDKKRNDLERSRKDLESKEYEIESEVEDSYWGLVKSWLSLELRRRSERLSARMHEVTLARVRTGAAAPVSTQRTEANLASARASLVEAENDYRRGQASLKTVLNLGEADLWSLELIPTDMPGYEPLQIDRERALADAVSNNLDICKTRLLIANAEISNLEAKNKVLPQLDLQARVGVSGLAGTDHPRDQVVQTGFVVPNPLPPDQYPQPYIMETVVIPGEESESAGTYGDAVENMFEGDDYFYSAGLMFRVPIGNRGAKADRERSMINYEKLHAEIQNQRKQVVLNMMNLVYSFEAADRSVLAAREARRLQERNLETEEKKYSLGASTSYEVMEAEESFEEARTSEISALIEYTKAKGRVERARKGYLPAGTAMAPSSISAAGLSAGAIPSGISQEMIEQYQGSLPAGIDMSQIQSMIR